MEKVKIVENVLETKMDKINIDLTSAMRDFYNDSQHLEYQDVIWVINCLGINCKDRLKKFRAKIKLPKIMKISISQPSKQLSFFMKN
mmetsp:Transcript_20842/g.18462  ORF Transcript_20842/g.18462 Transcript_20842/m.18462 type:complete len:87 (+) Transcript_20842:25-285(+)